MQKISFEVLEKLIQKNATAKEIDFILYIARFQSDFGRVTGVYYKDICAAIGISHQKFYDIKKSLIEKEIIECQKVNYTDWDIEILNNNFAKYTNEDYKAGNVKYISVNHKMFRQKSFMRLKGKAKLMAVQFLNINLVNQRAYEIGVSKLFKKYERLFGVTKKVIRKYLTMLRLFFSIGIKDGKYYITARKYMQSKDETENKAYRDNVVQTGVRRNRIEDISKKEYKDIIHVLNIYSKEIHQAEQFHRFSLSEFIRRSIEIINKDIANKRKWKRALRPSLINKLMSEEFRMA